jgi:ADP-ribosyl-[dinitrogen reductase] hydrolase
LEIPPRSRYRGALLGLAVGDALGTSLEFQPPGSFEPIDDMLGGGPFELAPGQWTDDTSMALCLAESLIECRGFDSVDQLRRYLRWYREGHNSSTGQLFDIGMTTRAALDRFEETGAPYPGVSDPRSAGNGSIMRLAPVPLAYADDIEEATERAGESSRTTHATTIAVDACRYFGRAIAAAARGETKETVLGDDLWNGGPLTPEVEMVARGSFKAKNPPEIRGRGYVAMSLEAALWALHTTDDFRTGALRAVNLGDDADTTGAVYGQLAGAIYGDDDIPNEWLERLAMRERITELADELLRLSAELARES